MKHPLKGAVAALCAAAALSACGTTGGVTHLDQGKALTDAWAALDGAAKSADQLALSGQLNGQKAATVAADLPKAVAILQAAQTAYDANHAVDISSQIADAAALTAAVVTIVAQPK